jgi:PhzF family phenazine biosynthesis protein
MKMKIYIANAFSNRKFGGNPAAVIPLKDWLSDMLMQQIASQNNLSETAFVVQQGEDYSIRWFTPTVEVDLCGHATLASAHVLFEHMNYTGNKIVFHSRSGPLQVTRNGDKISLNFPANAPEKISDDELIEKSIGIKPLAVFKSRFDYMVLLGSESDIETLKPDLVLVSKLPSRGLIVTAKGNDSDFVSRCFYPQSGINEDPVTGSAHTVMVPFWAKELGKNELTAIQLSVRKGYLDCKLADDRVVMSGQANTYLEGNCYV